MFPFKEKYQNSFQVKGVQGQTFVYNILNFQFQNLDPEINSLYFKLIACNDEIESDKMNLAMTGLKCSQIEFSDR